MGSSVGVAGKNSCVAIRNMRRVASPRMGWTRLVEINWKARCEEDEQ